MAEPIENKVTRSLKAAEELYHRLVLIVGKGGSGKTSVVQNLAKLHDAEPININLSLSKELLELTEKQRQLKLAEILLRLSTAMATRFFSIIWRSFLMLSSSRTRCVCCRDFPEI